MRAASRTALASFFAAVAAATALAADPPAPPQPRPGDLNPLVLRVIESIPADGTHTYWWPKGEKTSFGGSTADLVYDGVVVCEGEPEKRTYCCGLTLEVLFRAWEGWAKQKKSAFRIGALDAAGFKKLKGDWFCSGSVRDGPVTALVSRGLGVRIADLEAARPGDFVQLWRKKGSGHSVVFLGWVRGRAGEIVAIEYWSTQTATNGVGRRTERLDGENPVLRDQIYIARAGVARE